MHPLNIDFLCHFAAGHRLKGADEAAIPAPVQQHGTVCSSCEEDESSRGPGEHHRVKVHFYITTCSADYVRY